MLRLGSTLGSDATALVVVDPNEMFTTWKSIDPLTEPIGEAEHRITAESTQGADASNTTVTLNARDAQDLQQTAESYRNIAKVTLGDQHLDAKLFPHRHPFGSGSLRAEEGSGGMQQYAKNRLLLLESGFRRSPVWSFWMLERLMKNDLYFRERNRKKRHGQHLAAGAAKSVDQPAASAATEGHKRGTKRSAEDASLPEGFVPKKDDYANLFGQVMAGHIPESAAWWKSNQSRAQFEMCCCQHADQFLFSNLSLMCGSFVFVCSEL